LKAKNVRNLKCELQACAICWLVSAKYTASGRFFQGINDCLECAGIQKYNDVLAGEVKQFTDVIEQKIASGEVKSAEFKALCDELCQMLVDAHFDMAESNKEMLVRILRAKRARGL
jgi:hypothetical protein